MFKSLYQEFVYNGHLQALGASAVAYLSSKFVLNRPMDIIMLLLIYATYQIVYFFDRVRDRESDLSTNTERVEHINLHLNEIKIVFILFFIYILLGNVYFSGYSALIFCITIIVLGLYYPLKFKGLTKKIPLFKNLYVTLVYSLTIYFPLVYYDQFKPTQPAVLFLFLLVFLEMTVSQFALDIKDLETDKKNGLKTFPVIYGKSKSINLLYHLSFIIFVTLIITLPGFLRVTTLYIFIFLNLIYDLYYITMIKQSKKVGFFLSAGKFSFWLIYLILV